MDPETKEVITMDDHHGCIKVNIHGPDIILTPHSIPAEVKAAMQLSSLVVLDSNTLEKPSKRCKPSDEIISNEIKLHDLSTKQKKNREKSHCSWKKKRQLCGMCLSYMSTVLMVLLSISL